MEEYKDEDVKFRVQCNKLGPGYWDFGVLLCHDPGWHETYIRLGLIKYEVLIGKFWHHRDNY